MWKIQRMPFVVAVPHWYNSFFARVYWVSTCPGQVKKVLGKSSWVTLVVIYWYTCSYTGCMTFFIVSKVVSFYSQFITLTAVAWGMNRTRLTQQNLIHFLKEEEFYLKEMRAHLISLKGIKSSYFIIVILHSGLKIDVFTASRVI